MTDEERRLAELLQQAVPQPPRRIAASEIAAQVARAPGIAPPRLRLWLPAVAAAAVLLVAAASTVWLISGHSRPSAPTAQSSGATTGAATSAVSSAGTSPSRTASSSTSSEPSRSATGSTSSEPSRSATGSTSSEPSRIPPDVIGAFSARLLSGAAIGPIIVSGADAVYGLEPGFIDRFDPSSGAITARAPADPNANWPPLVTGRALWLTVVTPGAITIQMLDPTTLQQIGSSQIAAASPSGTGARWTPVLAADSDDSEIFLGNDDQIYFLNPTSGAVEHQSGVPGSVGGLAVSADGGRLYAGLNVQGSSIPRLLVLDVRHGLATLGNTPINDSHVPVAGSKVTVTGLLATSGGVWITVLFPDYGEGPASNNILFAPLTDLSKLREAVPGGGGLPATATVAGGSVFLSGIYQIECADPRTAAVRAQGSQMGELGLSHNFLSVQLVGGRYFASFQTNYGGSGESDVGLAVLRPPAACGG